MEILILTVIGIGFIIWFMLSYASKRAMVMKPMMIELPNGDKAWFLHGQLHRADGPAEELADGTKRWFLNGQRHRVDGPAQEWADGATFWYLYGEKHREDGPAVEWPDGSKFWFLNGKEVSAF